MDKTICRYCKEEINKDAKKCPHCHGWLVKWGLDFQNPKSIIIFLLLFFFIMMPAFIVIMTNLEEYLKKSKTKPNISETSYKIIEISTSSLNTYKCGDSKCIVISGVIENKSNSAWKDLYFHAELFNKHDQMIDNFSNHDYDIIVPVNGSTTFRISGYAVKDLSEYSKHKIYIRWARKIDE